MQQMTVVIPAASPGRRMRQVGPRSLLRLSTGETVLARQASLARRRWPGARLVVVAGYQSRRVRRSLPKGAECVADPDYERGTPTRSLSLGLAGATGRVVVVYGDLVFARDFLACVPDTGSAVLLEPPAPNRPCIPGAAVCRGRVCRLDFGLRPRWAQTFVLEGRELELFRQESRDHLFPWEVLNAVLDRGGVLQAVHASSCPVDVDCPRDLIATRGVLRR
jgi:CTP:molybdopterin cytidylyltransferase MocA